MKNKFRFFLMSVLACFCLASVVSCGDDDDDPVVPEKPNPVVPEKPNPEKGDTKTFSYKYECSQDLLDATVITLSYVNEEGKTITEQIDQLNWEKTLNVKVPFEANLKVSCKLKEGFTPISDNYKFISNLYLDGYANNKVVNAYSKEETLKVLEKEVIRQPQTLSKTIKVETE